MSWLPKDKVVVPVDFSEHSLAAVDAALELVADASHLYVLHVLPVLMDYEAGVIWPNFSDGDRSQRAEAALRERLAGPRHEGIHISVSFGDPGHEIADFAEANGAELIVLPSHGVTGLKRLLIGSVAERVVRMAHCPVLVLKTHAPESKQQETRR